MWCLWQISAVLLCFCLSSWGFTITCGLLVAISLTRMFIIVKVTRYDPRISHLSANRVSQPEPRAGFLRGLHQPRPPRPRLQLRLGFPLPSQRHGWAVHNNPENMVLGELGPRQLGPNSWDPVHFWGGQLGPRAQLFGVQLSVAQLSGPGPNSPRTKNIPLAKLTISDWST